MKPSQTAAAAPPSARSAWLLRVGWWPMLLVTQAVDLIVRWPLMQAWPAWGWLVWALSWLVSVGLWWGALGLTARLAARSRWAVAAVVALPLFAVNFCVVSTWIYVRVMGDYPVSTTLQYMIEEPESSWSFVVPFLKEPVPGALVFGLPVALLVWWVVLAQRRAQAAAPAPSRWAKAWRIGRVAAVAAVAVVLFARPNVYAFMAPDVHTAAQVLNVGRLMIFGASDQLHVGHRADVPPQAAEPDRPDVLWIVHESLAPRQTSLYGAPWATTPEHERLVREAGEGAVVFEDAQSSSGFTLISVVSMMTGLAPDRTSLDFHTVPLPWDWAEAAGYEPFLFTAQSYAWGNFGAFLLTPSLRTWQCAENSGLPVVNDVGVDDGVIVERMLGHLDTVAAARAKGERRPFFGVLHFNGTHFPHLRREGFTREWEVKDARDQPLLDSVLYIDHLVGQVWDGLAARGLRDNTLVVITSDHGSHLASEDQPHIRSRSENYYEIVTRVPLIVIVPPGARPGLKAGLSALRANRGQRVSNLDLLPTLLDAMGIDGEDVAPLRAELDGRSLLRPLPAERWVLYTNLTAFRGKERQGFALTRGAFKYVFFEHDGQCDEEAYDLAADPWELNNRWASTAPELKREVYAQIQRSPWLARIRMERGCPLDPRAQRSSELTRSAGAP